MFISKIRRIYSVAQHTSIAADLSNCTSSINIIQDPALIRADGTENILGRVEVKSGDFAGMRGDGGRRVAAVIPYPHNTR